MVFTESMLNGYSQPLSETEDQRCKRAINMVRDALRNIGYSTPATAPDILVADSYAYTYEMRNAAGKKVRLLVQGSYANNTNVKQNSDVDIAVILESTFETNYRPGVTGERYGFTDSSETALSFKDAVEKILRDYFVTGVERKNKSIKVHGNSYRVDADTVPCLRYRDYRNDYRFDPDNYTGGIVIHADDGAKIYNYPEQHIRNGKVKNAATNHIYKKMVRIMKKMRYLMEDCDISAASKVSSFALESLLWNIPDSWYLEYKDFRKVFVFNQLISYLHAHVGEMPGYLEANGIKKLFPTARDVENMNSFLNALNRFYQYQ